jgi:hypothetical protein
VSFRFYHCHKVGHILVDCEYEFHKKIHGEVRLVVEVRIVSPKFPQVARDPSLSHSSLKLGVGGTNGQPIVLQKMGMQNVFCVGDIPIQLDVVVSQKLEGHAQLDLFEDYLDFLPS